MELFQELLITVGISLLVSFVIAKLFSMASPSHSATVNNSNDSYSPSVSVTRAIEEASFIAQNREEEKSTRVYVIDEAVELNQHENDLSRAQAAGSRLNFDDDNEVVLNREGSETSSAVGLENTIELEGNILSIELEGNILSEAVKVGGVEFDDQLFDGMPERAKFREIEIESGRHEVNVGESEGNKGNESDGVVSNENESGEEGEGDFGDWEGVERTELEKRFGDAVVFVGSKSNADRISRIDSDAKMQLYGLHKVVIEGPCSVPSPMALKVSARAKWNAWQQLGDMSREEAMEQYISLLSRSIPGWTGYDAKGFLDEKSAPVSNINVYNQDVTETESKLRELKPDDEGCGMTGSMQTP